ncbi:MAG: carbohydrate-binding protein, partial [Bacteroidota bacterium]
IDQDLLVVEVVIEGRFAPAKPIGLVAVCDELKQHPQYRAFASGDPAYNDIQCGNGPFNNAADESGCPGRVDQGSAGCNVIGVTWDTAWLATRPRFSGDTPPDPLAIPGRVEAEDFIVDSGIKTESHNDGGGSMGIGSIHSGDHVDFSVEVSQAGTYELQARISSNTQGGTVTFLIGEDEVGSLAVSGTGSWNNWQTTGATSLTLPAGQHILRLRFTGQSGFLLNMNWFEVTLTATGIDEATASNGLHLYPNPAKNEIHLEADGMEPLARVEIFNAQGRLVHLGQLTQDPVDLSHLSSGVYLVRVSDHRQAWSKRLLIE